MNPTPQNDVSRCGYVAIVGRPNVGKSTLLNHLLEQKLSITSRKPQTTRHNVLGIKTQGAVQILFVDTPGLHQNQTKAINRYMNRAASSAIGDVDVIVFVVDRLVWTDEDEMVARRLCGAKCPIILVINKIDQIDEKSALLPHIGVLSERFLVKESERFLVKESERFLVKESERFLVKEPERFLAKEPEHLSVEEIVPISALRNDNLEALEKLIVDRLPRGEHFFPEDQLTDRSSRFMAAEMVREKITRQLGAELPYQMTVEIEEFKQEGAILHIAALVLVERDSQKRILIGDRGARIKKIGQNARLDMEALFQCKVMLKLWVKVKSGWSDDERALRSLGYDD